MYVLILRYVHDHFYRAGDKLMQTLQTWDLTKFLNEFSIIPDCLMIKLLTSDTKTRNGKYLIMNEMSYFRFRRKR